MNGHDFELEGLTIPETMGSRLHRLENPWPFSRALVIVSPLFPKLNSSLMFGNRQS
jgi:hypothetical protein